MTPDELKTLIASDAEATRLANSGAADLCAARCKAIAPHVPVETRLTELSILNIYTDPEDAEAVLSQVETVSNANPVVRRVLKWLQPGAPGVDFGDARVRSLLTAPVSRGGIGLTDKQAAPLLQASSAPPTITGEDVSTAWPYTGQ